MIARTLLITQFPHEPSITLTSICCTLPMIAYSNSTTLARPFNTSFVLTAIWTSPALLDGLDQRLNCEVSAGCEEAIVHIELCVIETCQEASA
eukprot:SAG11_NODE_16791_length_537_cov_2.196347_2_plen_92_part_01